MIDFIKRYNQFLILLSMWMLFAFLGGSTAAYIIVGLSTLLLASSKRYFELLLGFFFLLLLSDNLDERLWFAKTFKNFYMVLMGLVVITDREKFKPFSNLFNLFLPFILLAIFALQFSGSFGVGAQKTVSYILLLITIPNFFKLLYRQEGISFLRDIVYFLVLILVVGYLSKYLSFEFAYIEGGRMRGLFGNPNGLGIFLFLFFSFFKFTNTFYPTLFNLNEKRFIYFVIYAALIFCGSRTAFICILMFVILEKIHLISPYIGFLILVAVIYSYEVIMNNIVSIIKSFGMEQYFRINTLEEGSGRFVAWAFAWDKIQNFYFFGGGLGNDEFIMRKNYGILTKLGHQGGVHNSYLTFWFDVGIVGLVTYLRSLVLVFIKGAKKTPLAIPFMYSVLFSMTYESWIVGSLNPFTIILFFSFALIFEDEFVPQEIPEEVDEKKELFNNLKHEETKAH